ncbi:MAG: hypothetical protein A2017_01365 [Lentisphaerae bacterium GWF2_44_16]|nr:MAG: hypothetical protein A2017_01365 [Lentisphaerae bacterium GWF2_44_16]
MIETIKFKQEEVYDRLKADILAGRLKEAAQLPKEVDLARSLGVARGTLRNVLDMLENDGLIVRLRSKGTFVKPRNQGTETRKILILLDTINQSDITWPSNYIIPGIENEAGKLGMKTEVCPLHFVSGMDIDAGVSFLQKADIYGAVIFGGRFTGNEPYIRMLRKLGKPVVMAHAYPGDYRTTGFASIRTDLLDSWRTGIRYLKSKGHQCIATINAKVFRGYEEDTEGYYRFLEKEGICNPDLIKIVKYDYANIKNTLTGFMKLGETPTAVLCYSDFYAMHLLQAAKELGIKVPDDLAVMGYCGFPGGAYLDPPLSTVDFHYFRIGETVVRIFDKAHEWFAIEGVSAPDIVFPYEIVERKSTLTKRLEGAFL